jgi:cell division protein FtsW (lipid II flippase)
MTLQNRSRLRYPERLLAVFAVASFVAVAAGCLVVAVDGAPAGAWPLNLAAWGAGAVMALAVSRFASPPFARAVTFAAPVGLLASLANPGQAGVHRWIDIGPVQANVAALLLPAFVVALAALVRDGSWIWLSCAACAVLLVLQPDASQATAFAAAVLIVVVRPPVARAIRVSIVVLVSSGAAIAWLRPDPLAPVAEVEGIVGLAYALWPPIAIVAVVALGGAALAPMVAATRPKRSAARTAALALSVYFVFSALTPLFGAFPVPLVGIGVSPVVGFWMGAGLLVAVASWESADPE